MKKILRFSTIVMVVALLAVTYTSQSAFAHGGRQVKDYHFVVGFLEEPAYAQLKNSIDLTLCKGKECTYTVKDGTRVVANPVSGADQTLKAEVTMGSSAPLALPLSERFNQPGKYVSYFVPSQEGSYTFRVYGTIEGQQIDEKFTSGVDGFDDVEAIQSYPSTSEGNTQGSNTANSGGDTAALQNQVKAAQDSANNATTFGIIGIVAGILGLAVAGFALARKPKAAKSAAGETSSENPVDSLRG